MTQRITLSRRSFLAGTAAAGGLSLGLALPGAAQNATGSTPELNAWVVINPDNTVVVRVAKIEMGQGTLTGLAQLVAEELECDWDTVTWSYPTPGENVGAGPDLGVLRHLWQPGHPHVAADGARRWGRGTAHAFAGCSEPLGRRCR